VGVAYNFTTPKAPQEMCSGSGGATPGQARANALVKSLCPGRCPAKIKQRQKVPM